MATISTLAVNLIARTGIFERKMKKSRRQIMSFRNQAKLARRAALRFGAGLLAVAGVGGLGFMIAKSMKAIDATAKLAASLDISTEALKGLELAAKISGAELTTITKGIEIMVRRLGEAKLGIGEAKRALDTMGLSVDDLVTAGTEEAFKQIAEELSKIPAAADRAVAAYMIFGRQGVKLLNTFKDGRAGIEAFRKEAERLGVTFNAIDAAKVEAANDAIVRARTVLEGLITKVTVELAPVIEAMAMQFVDVATAGEGAGNAIAGSFERAAISVAKLADIISAFDPKAAGKGILERTIPVLIIAKGIKDARDVAGDVIADGMGKAERSIRDFFDNVRAESEALRTKMEADAASRAEAIAGRAEFEREFAKTEVLMKEAGRIFDQTRTPIEKFETEIGKLSDLLDKGAITWDTYTRAVKLARGTLQGVGISKPSQAGQFEVIRRSLVSVTGLDTLRVSPELEESKKQTRLLERIADKEGIG